MPAGWRFLAQRLTGSAAGEFLDFDVPLQGSAITDVLSGHNSLSGTITPEIMRLIGSDGEPIFGEYDTAIYAEESGEIRGGGILVGSDFNGSAWNLECVGFTGVLIDQPYTDAWFGVEIDPLDVVRHIWTHWQSKPGGDLGLVVDDLKTGLKIGTELEQIEFDTENGPVAFEAGPIKLAWYQTHNLAGEIDNLAESTPFDWHERHYWSGDAVAHKLDFAYPRMGNRQENLRFVIGENVWAQPAIDRDGADYASEVLVLGAGEGRKMVRGYASRPVRGLRRVAVASDPDLRSLRAVNRRAQAELAWRNNLDDVSDILVRDHPHAPVGAVEVGDEIRIEGKAGWRDLDMWVRVLSKTVNPDQGNTLSLSVTRTDRLAS